MEENIPEKETAMNKMKNVSEKSQQYWKVQLNIFHRSEVVINQNLPS
jgi:hypothetical protein